MRSSTRQNYYKLTHENAVGLKLSFHFGIIANGINMAKRIEIDPMSVVPLFLECYANQTILRTGTGFVVTKNNINYLITNWHVLSGRDPTNNQVLSPSGAVPDQIAIWHHVIGRLGTWQPKLLSLNQLNGSPSWTYRTHNQKVIDVASLPLPSDNSVQLYPLDTALANTDLLLPPSEPVSIVGFPYSLTSSGKLPIWKTGHIASDIDIDYEEMPVFLIDATTKPGMSGSPVIARRVGMHLSSQGVNMGGQSIRFLGIYSGRIHNQADVGIVWKPETIIALLP